ncbi:MAG TPA: response regulator [Prosthecochloris aestuarii]|jgi:two-component system, cell cycle response regulator CpdR|uniref:Response regulator n=1 Tax=Prosthecochloris aestuarii TaxID=1102 RepID=A0A831SMS8_PROAE|nr:response regulator [Prosthecochloris aestuarii]
MKKILVIDDEHDILKLLRRILENAGYCVTMTDNGKDAEKLLEKELFHLVITDIIMPEKEGMEMIFFIRKHCPETKIIAISGGGKLSPDSYLTIAHTAGADTVIQKPFENSELLREVKQLL